MSRLPDMPALDGLRGIAVAAVLLYHGDVEWMPGGYLGVSTFFTLSGFLITALLIREVELTGRVDLAAFWERRARRVLPASFVALLGVALFGALAAEESQRRVLLADGLAALGWVANWWFIVSRREYMDQFGAPSPVLHFWSLAIEEQFYVVFPFVVALVVWWSRRWRVTLGVVVATMAAASAGLLVGLEASDASTSRLYFGTDTRAAELLAGALLAIALGGRPPAPAGAARYAFAALALGGLAFSMLCWVGLAQDDVRFYRGGLLVYALGSVAVIAAAALPSGPVRALLASSPLRWLGRISYGAYLYHFPVFLWLTPERLGVEGWVLFTLRTAISLGLAELSYRMVEAPVRERRLVRSGRAWLTVPAAVAVVAGAIAAVPGARVGAGESRATAPSVPCRPDALRVLVIGDSVAQGIADGLARWAHTDGRMAVVANTQSACGIAPGHEVARVLSTRSERCRGWTPTWAFDVARVRRTSWWSTRAAGTW